MSWRNRLGECEFIGIKFHSEVTEIQTGRRIITQQLYQSNEIIRQDLGRKPRIYEVEGYIMATEENNYDPHKDYLRLQALVENGVVSSFRHPYHGVIADTICAELRQTDTRDRGGIVRFEAVFVSERVATFRGVETDTNEELSGNGDKLVEFAVRDYTENPSDVSSPDAFNAFFDAVDAFVETVDSYRLPFEGAADGVWQRLQRVSSSANNIDRVIRNRLTDSRIFSADVRTLLRGVGSGDVRRILGLLNGLSSFEPSARPDFSTSQSRVRAGFHPQQFTNLVRRVAVGSATETLSAVELGDVFPNFVEGAEFQAGLNGAIDQLEIQADSSSDSELFQSLTDLRISAGQYFSEQLPALPRVRRERVQNLTPAIVVANRIAGSADAENLGDSIARRNRVFFPLMASGDLEVVI